LRAYQQARRTLADELGLEPGAELKELEQSILRQDPTLTLERPTELQTEPEPPAPEAAPVPVFERKRRTVPAWFLSRRPAVGAVAVALALGATAIAAVLATRARDSQESMVGVNAVGLIGGDGDRVRDQVEVGDAPSSVAFGYGSVWVTSASANTVSRIDP
jgi:Bacterial transcriptional activator domain